MTHFLIDVDEVKGYTCGKCNGKIEGLGKRVTSCTHIFHVLCLIDLLKYGEKKFCPKCRVEFLPHECYCGYCGSDDTVIVRKHEGCCFSGRYRNAVHVAKVNIFVMSMSRKKSILEIPKISKVSLCSEHGHLRGLS